MCAHVRQKKEPKYSAIMLSFVGAVLFWFFNVLQSDYTTQISVKVDYSFKRNKDSLAIIAAPKNIVNVELRGRGWDLIKHYVGFFDESVKFEVVNPTKKKVVDKVPLLDEIKKILSDVEVLRIVNDSIKYDVQSVKIKFLFFKLKKNNLFNKGIKWDKNPISKIELSKKKGTLIGPKSALDTVNSYYPIMLLPIDSSQIGYTCQQTFVLSDRFKEKYFSISPKQIEATIFFKDMKKKGKE